MKRIFLTAVAVAGCWAIPAQAQMVRAQKPESVVSALQAAGHPATLGVDKLGDPEISSEFQGTKFKIFFYNCTDHKACATIQFHSGYDLKQAVSLARINEWNQTQRFGRAHLDKENDPILQMDLDLDDGGVSSDLFEDNVEFWTSVLMRFETHIGFRS